MLSIFPGIDLLGKAFEEVGFTVVRGPDCLWGGDIRRFHPPAGKFSGIIGGPPCQPFSNASHIRGTDAEDLIPEFVRCVKEARPDWVVMENVPQSISHPAIPKDWNLTLLNDHDCGGLTSRTRAFWLWPLFTLSPGMRGRAPSKSVMASTWKRGSSDSQYVAEKGFLPGDLPIEQYGRLQGCQALAEQLRDHPSKPSRSFIVHVLGNGVPLSMGRTIARAVCDSHPLTPTEKE